MNYSTKQRDALLRYLKEFPGKHFTVQDISDHLREEEIPIGTTTLYRHLNRMVEEGIVNKYITDNIGSACFEYVGEGESCEESQCFHLKCEKCNKLIHMSCGELGLISNHLMQDHGFKLDSLRTVFYGICEDCRDDADKHRSVIHNCHGHISHGHHNCGGNSNF